MRRPSRSVREARRGCGGILWGSKSRRCKSGRVAVLVNGTAEEARTEEPASLEAVRSDGRLVGAWRKLMAGSMGAVLVVVPYVGGQDLSGVGLVHDEDVV